MERFMKMQKKMSLAESTRQVLNKSIDLLHKLSNKKIAFDGAKKELSSVLSHYFISLYSESKGVDENLKIKLEFLLDQAYDILIKVDNGKTPLYEAIMLMNKVVMQNQPTDSEEKAESIKEPVKEKEADEGFMTSEFDLSGDPKEKGGKGWFFKKPEYLKKEEPVMKEPVVLKEEPLFREEVVPKREEVELKREEAPPRRDELVASMKEPIQESRSKGASELLSEVIRQKEELERSVKALNDTLYQIGFEVRPIAKP